MKRVIVSQRKFGCFYFLAIMKIAAVNTHVLKILFGHISSFVLGTRIGTARAYSNSTFIL